MAMLLFVTALIAVCGLLYLVFGLPLAYGVAIITPRPPRKREVALAVSRRVSALMVCSATRRVSEKLFTRRAVWSADQPDA